METSGQPHGRERTPVFTLFRTLGGPQSWSGYFGRKFQDCERSQSGKWKCAEMNPVRCPNRILRTRWRWRSGPESRGAPRCPISSSVDRYAAGAQPRTHLYLRPSQEYHLCNEGQHPADVCCGIQGARRGGSL